MRPTTPGKPAAAVSSCRAAAKAAAAAAAVCCARSSAAARACARPSRPRTAASSAARGRVQDGCSQSRADADSTAAQPGVSIAASGHALRTRLQHRVHAGAWLCVLLGTCDPQCESLPALLGRHPETRQLNAPASVLTSTMNVHNSVRWLRPGWGGAAQASTRVCTAQSGGRHLACATRAATSKCASALAPSLASAAWEPAGGVWLRECASRAPQSGGPSSADSGAKKSSRCATGRPCCASARQQRSASACRRARAQLARQGRACPCSAGLVNSTVQVHVHCGVWACIYRARHCLTTILCFDTWIEVRWPEARMCVAHLQPRIVSSGGWLGRYGVAGDNDALHVRWKT